MEERIIKDINNLLTQLFQKMHEAGYEWDAEQKKLKNIEPKHAAWSEEDEDKLKSILFHIEDVENKDVIDWLKSLKDRVQPKQEWSEEEEKNFKKAIKVLKVTNFHNTADMLQEMRYKLIPKQEWSEEEQQTIEDAASFILACVNTAETKEEEERLEKLADKLQDLRPQKQWKPSEEQIATIEYIIKGYESTTIHLYDGAAKQLYLLLEQLKQL